MLLHLRVEKFPAQGCRLRRRAPTGGATESLPPTPDTPHQGRFPGAPSPVLKLQGRLKGKSLSRDRASTSRLREGHWDPQTRNPQNSQDSPAKGSHGKTENGKSRQDRSARDGIPQRRQNQMSEPQNAGTQMKNSFLELINIPDSTEERMSELEAVSTKTSKKESKTGREGRERTKHLRTRDNKRCKVGLMGIQEKEEENFPN